MEDKTVGQSAHTIHEPVLAPAAEAATLEDQADSIIDQVKTDWIGDLEGLTERVSKLEQALTPLQEPDEAPPAKIPKLTVICLSVLCILAVATGLHHWYNTYYLPVDAVTPAHAEVAGFQPPPPQGPPPSGATALLPPEITGVGVNDNDENDNEEPYEPFIIPRPVLEPRPQFVELWDYFGKTNIVGHLFIEDTDLNEYVLQNENNENMPDDWVFIDYQVDILMGDALNWVIHGQDGSPMQSMLSAYFDYDFFLRHPVITFNTQYAEYEWEIFTFYVAPMNFPFAVVDHQQENWGDMVESFTLAGLYNTRLDVTEYDQILTLTTPASGAPGLYYVLQARLLRHITS